MNLAFWAKMSGLISMFWCGGASMQSQVPCGQPAGCPLASCQTAPLVPLDPPAPMVTLKVRVPANSMPGKELEYRYFIENASPGDAHHVIVRNPLPANVKFVRASPAPHQMEPELQWHLGTMHGGAKCEISLIVLPTGADDIKNCVRIQYEHGQCVTTRLAQAPPGAEPPLHDGKPKMPKVEAIPPEKPAKLKLTMEGPKDRYANMPARYFITVTNTGKGLATNLLVRATLPEKTEFISASDDGVHLMSQVAWLLKDLEPGAKRTVELNFKSQGTGQRCVKVSALADGGVSDQGELCTNFAGASALLLELFDRQDPVGIGRDASYPIIVHNTGSAPMTNVLIRARVPKEMVLARTVPADHKLAERAPQGQWLIFGPATVEPGSKTQFEVFVKAVAAGDARFRVEMTADQLDPARGPVIGEEPTTIYDDTGKIPVKMLSRKKN